MKDIVATILVFVLGSICWGTELPNAPKPQVENDPGAWAVTAAAPVILIGAFTKPSYGLAAGIAVSVFGNGLQNSNNSHVDMLGGIGGAVAGYCVIKTLRHDWRHHKHVRPLR